MINNYNSSGWRAGTYPETQLEKINGSPPNLFKKMKSTWLMGIFLMAFMLLGIKSYGQLPGSYSFATATGTSLESMTGATNLLAYTASPLVNDDNASAVTNIGFNFVFNGVTYTQFSVNANGLMRLGTTVVSTAFSNGAATSTSNWFNTTANTPLISAYFDDLALGSGGTGGKVNFVVSGVSPNRKLAVQWLVTIPRNTAGTPAGIFQVVLEETTNKISFIYGSGVVANTGNYSVGIASANSGANAMQSITTSTNTASITTYNPLNSGAITAGRSYTFTPPPPCSGTPAPGNTLSSVASTCSGVSFNLTLQNTTAGTGVTYQWQSADDVAFSTGLVALGTASTQTTSITAAKFFRCLVTCSGSTTTSTPVNVTLNPFLTCYPAVFASSTSDEEITNVTIGTLNNTSNCTIAATGTGSILNRYANYANVVTTPSVSQQDVVNFSLTQFSCGGVFGNGFQVYIDYNQNGSYADAGEQVYSQPVAASGNHTKTGTFTVPLSALTGTTGMRVVNVETTFPTVTNYATTGYSFGETEDYLITIIAAVPCTGTPVAGTISPASITGCSGSANTSSFSAAGFSTGTGITFQWEQSTDGTTGWTAVTTGTGGTTSTYTPASTTTMYYRMGISCAASPLVYSSVVQLNFVNCDYNVTRTTGITYNSIDTTGIGLTGFTSTDDSSSSATNIGFNFFYKGTTFTQFVANTNGFLGLGASTASSFTNSLGTGVNLIAPYWDDLFVTGGGNAASISNFIKYKLDGIAPNRILTVEWIGMEQFQNAGPNINFQVKLYETSNRIEIVHGQMQTFDGSTGTGNAYTYSLGIAGPGTSTGTIRTLALLGENSNAFTATDSGSLSIPPACNVSYSFDAAAAYTGATTFAYTVPTNDNVAGAIALPVNASPCQNLCGTYYNSNLATASPQTSTCTTAPDDDVWFTFVAPTSGQVLVSVKSASGNDAVVSVLDTTFANVGTFGCTNAVGNALTENLNATVLTAGAVYYVRVSNNGIGSGNRSGFSICVSDSFIPPPVNDNPCGAVALTPSTTCAPFSDTTTGISGTTNVTGATTTTSNNVVTPTQTGAVANVSDVWFKFIATSDYHGITVTPVPGFDVAIQAYGIDAGTTCPTTLTLTSLGTVNGAGSGTAENVQFATIVGTEYYLRVFRHPSGIAGNPVNNSQFSICVFNPAPACVVNTAPVNAATGVSANPTLTWPTTAFASSYDVYLGTTSGPTTLLANVPNTLGATSYSYVLTAPQTLNELTQYYWYVTPKNTVGSAPCGAANQTTFTTAAIPVVVSSFAPTAVCAGGTNAERTIVITGTGFSAANAVTVNSVAVQSFIVNSNTQITAIVAGTNTTGTISVTKSSGFGTSTTSLTVNPQPVVTPISGSSNSMCTSTNMILTNSTPTGIWSSSNNTVATVVGGDVSALTAGSVVISYAVTIDGCTTTVTYPITINEKVVVTTQPISQTIITGSPVTFTVAATGSGLSYQWQFNDNVNGYVNLTGEVNPSFTIPSTSVSNNGYLFRCVVSGISPCGPINSNFATLTVGNTGIGNQPLNQAICGSGTVTFTASATGDVVSYQWYLTDALGDIALVDSANISGATTNTLILSGLTTANNGENYYLVVTGNANTATTNSALLTVSVPAVVSIASANNTACYTGGSVTFNASATGSFSGYQWQYSNDNFATAGSPVTNGTPVGATDRKSTRLNSSHPSISRMPSSA